MLRFNPLWRRSHIVRCRPRVLVAPSALSNLRGIPLATARADCSHGDASTLRSRTSFPSTARSGQYVVAKSTRPQMGRRTVLGGRGSRGDVTGFGTVPLWSNFLSITCRSFLNKSRFLVCHIPHLSPRITRFLTTGYLVGITPRTKAEAGPPKTQP